MRDIHIFLVDDHSLFRESLGRLLEANPHLRVVGQCASVEEALAELSRTSVDVVLLDYELGEESGFRLLTELNCGPTETKVLMVTAGVSDEVALHVMDAGASGIFLKKGRPEELITAIQRVANGELWLDDDTFRSLLAIRQNRSEVLERARPLTSRQSQVLRGILNGLANKEIAWKLRVSETSVKATIQELFQKAGVRTRSQLVRIAIEQHSADWLKPE